MSGVSNLQDIAPLRRDNTTPSPHQLPCRTRGREAACDRSPAPSPTPRASEAFTIARGAAGPRSPPRKPPTVADAMYASSHHQDLHVSQDRSAEHRENQACVSERARGQATAERYAAASFRPIPGDAVKCTGIASFRTPPAPPWISASTFSDTPAGTTTLTIPDRALEPTGTAGDVRAHQS
jgi:hypothetical protein